jgi:hypothetical protein
MGTSSELEQLQMTANSFELQLAHDSWFELMHWHPDIYGTGNASPAARHACTLLAKQYLCTAMSALRTWHKESQCWCILDPSDSGEDAVYVHTENPNRPNFPYQYEGVSWDFSAPSWVISVFSSPQYLIGRSGEGEGLLYWVVESSHHPLVNRRLPSC